MTDPIFLGVKVPGITGLASLGTTVEPADGDVATYDTATGKWTAAAAGGGGILLDSGWVQVTNAEMLNLAASPKQLVAAGGTGSVYSVLAWELYFKTLAAPYTHAQDADQLGLLTSQNDEYVALRMSLYNVGALSSSGAPIRMFPASLIAATQPTQAEMTVDNEPILFGLPLGGADFGGGDAGNVVYARCLYTKVALP